MQRPVTEAADEPLSRLAELLGSRNEIDGEIARLIGRPAERGHIGEFIASHVFGIRLAESATNRAIDGWFDGGPLAGRSVNVKFYGRQEDGLDMSPSGTVDYYLVLTGSRSAAGSSRGASRPLTIEHVFLLEAESLHVELEARGVKLGIATSVRRSVWTTSEIYPADNPKVLHLDHETRERLNAFTETPND